VDIAQTLTKPVGGVPLAVWLLAGGVGVALAVQARNGRETTTTAREVVEVPVPVGAIAGEDRAPLVTAPIIRINVPEVQQLQEAVKQSTGAVQDSTEAVRAATEAAAKRAAEAQAQANAAAAKARADAEARAREEAQRKAANAARAAAEAKQRAARKADLTREIDQLTTRINGLQKQRDNLIAVMKKNPKLKQPTTPAKLWSEIEAARKVRADLKAQRDKL